MAEWLEGWWGKSEVRVSKLHRGPEEDGFSDLTVQVLLENDDAGPYTEGDNSTVLPTDTMRNTIYGLAQEHLGSDLEGFAVRLGEHFTARSDVARARVRIEARRWDRVTPTGFVGGGSERRTTRAQVGDDAPQLTSGVIGLLLLKTSGSAFAGFPRDEYTVLPEAGDRLLATTVSADWDYATLPTDTTGAWVAARAALLEGFFGAPSESLQHQGWLMGQGVLAAVPEISRIRLSLPNQHHLPFDLGRFGLADEGIVFHPVTEPHGDIGLTVGR